MFRRPQRESLILGRMSRGRDCMARPVLSSGMLAKHPCLGTRSGPISIPGSLQTRGPGVRLSFRGTELSPGSHRHHAPQHHSTTVHGPGCQHCISLFHNHYQGAPVRCWGCVWGSGLAEIPRKNHNCSGPSTHRNQGQAEESARPVSASAHREGLLKLCSLHLLLSSGHSVLGTSHWIQGGPGPGPPCNCVLERSRRPACWVVGRRTVGM